MIGRTKRFFFFIEFTAEKVYIEQDSIKTFLDAVFIEFSSESGTLPVFRLVAFSRAKTVSQTIREIPIRRLIGIFKRGESKTHAILCKNYCTGT